MTKAIALLVLLCAADAADAAPVETVVRDALARDLPADLGVVDVHVPKALSKLDVEPGTATVSVHGALRAGRPSVKVMLGKRTIFVPVTLAPLMPVAVVQRALRRDASIGPDDIAVEMRPVAGADAAIVVGARVTHALSPGDVVGADDITLPPPLSRGTEIAVEVRNGALVIKGTGKLELAARIGEHTTARLGATSTVVRGVLAAGPTLVVGGQP